MANDLGAQDFTYTRAGAFKLNQITSLLMQAVTTYKVSVDEATGDTTSVSLSTSSALQIPDASGSPRATTNVYSSFN